MPKNVLSSMEILHALGKTGEYGVQCSAPVPICSHQGQQMFENSSKTQKSEDLENETFFFLQMKNLFMLY